MFVRLCLCVTLRPPHPWILKRAGLESSGWRLISSIGKTKRIAFNFSAKKFKNVQLFWGVKLIFGKNFIILNFFHIFEIFEILWDLFLDYFWIFNFFKILFRCFEFTGVTFFRIKVTKVTTKSYWDCYFTQKINLK